MSRPAARVAVIGGGISGLAAAHHLVELSRTGGRPIDLRLFEAGERLGGVIATECRDGFVIETGPDSFLSEKPAALALCERLGLTDRLVGTREEFRRTYVVREGRLQVLPDGFLLLAPTRLWPLVATPLFSWPGKLRMALDLVLPRGSGDDESLGSFVRRRLGREALERVAQPLIGGIYTADPERLSLRATMPRFLEMEQAQGSIIAAMWRQQRAARRRTADSGARWSLFLSFDAGLQVLVDALAQRLPEGVVQLRRPVASLARSARGTWRVDEFECDAVIVATPAHAAATLLHPLDAELGAELSAIEYASSAIASLIFRREDIPHPLDGFGFVVPRIEGRLLLAGTFSSLKYPGRAPAEYVLVRAFLGGALQPEVLALDDGALLTAVHGELEALLGIRRPPQRSVLTRWPAAMPQYHVGHLERVARITRRGAAHPGLALAGNAYAGVGIPDCIRSGEAAAEMIVAGLSAK
ncbi:MAG: protoporphyrinogen oxidase [Candidatus Binatia bacterium]